MLRSTSIAGLRFVMHTEGFRTQPYQDGAGVWTIGYGHRITKAEEAIGLGRAPLTADEGAVIFWKDISFAEEGVGTLVLVSLTQGQFDALISFTFNFGAGNLNTSTLLRQLNTGDYRSVPTQLRRWVNVRLPNGTLVKEDGLVARRETEVILWNL